MIDHINTTFPPEPSDQQRARYLLAIELAAMTATPPEERGILPALGEHWKKHSADPLQRRIGEIIHHLGRYPEPANQHDITMIWQEISKVIWRREQEAAKDAILQFARYVAAQESRVGDVTDMPEEQAHRTLRRLATLNGILNALATWHDQEQELWAAVVAWQQEAQARIDKLEDVMSSVVWDMYRKDKEIEFLKEEIRWYLRALESDKQHVDLLTKLYIDKCATS